MSESESSADPKASFPSAPGTIDHSDSARFEGEVDLAAERPSTTLHGLHTDRSTRWLVGGLVGASLALAAIVSIIRASADDEAPSAAPRNAEVVLLEPLLEPSLVQAIIALELVRMDSISAHAVRAMLDAPPSPGLARRAPVGAHAQPVAREPSTPARTSGRPTTTVRDLPVPQVDAPPPAAADPPPRNDAAGDGGEQPLPSISDDEAAPDDRSRAPS